MSKDELKPTNRKRSRDTQTNEGIPAKKMTLQKNPGERAAEGQVDDSVGHMDGSLLADHFAKKIKHFLGDLSVVELDEKYLPAKAFLDTSSFASPRNLTNLPLFLEKFSSGDKESLRQTADATSSPHTLVVTSSGIRAADVTRSLRVFHSSDAAVAKLFAKHIKLADSVEYVRKTRIGIGIGTPVRINDVLKSGALKTKNLQRILIDLSYLDQKKRSITDMKELFLPLLDLLTRGEISNRYGVGKEGSIDLVVY